MTIETNIKYSLTAVSKKIVITYHTYEKAPYDAYLCTSIVKAYKKDEDDINAYIDDLTGNGSLNRHFKKLCHQIMELDDNDIDDILQNNRFPVTKIDESGRFTYIEDLGVSRVNKKYYQGDISENKEMLVNLSDIEDENPQIVSIETKELTDKNSQSTITDIFKTTFSDDGVWIEIPGVKGLIYVTYSKFIDFVVGKLVPDFHFVYINRYNAKVHINSTEPIKADILTQQTIDGFESYVSFPIDENLFYIPQDENANGLWEIAVYVFNGFYFYTRTLHPYGETSTRICDEALTYLLQKGDINTFKTKALIKLLKSCSEPMAAQGANYVLNVKDSKEIAEFGLTILSDETKDYWHAFSLNKLKQVASASQLNYIYSIDEGRLTYSLAEILKINDSALRPEHKKMKEDYLANRQEKIAQYNTMYGEILSSKVRDRMKRLPKKEQQDSNAVTLKKFLNETIHSTEGLNDLDDAKLDSELEKLTNIYNHQYPYVIKLCKKAEEAND